MKNPKYNHLTRVKIFIKMKYKNKFTSNIYCFTLRLESKRIIYENDSFLPIQNPINTI